MSFVDLTLPIAPDMPTNPDHIRPEVSTYGTLENEGWLASRLLLSSHSGTHVDAPSHFIESGGSVDGIRLETLIGDAQVVHLGEAAPHSSIGATDLGAITSERVLICTGWNETQLGRDNYFSEYPFLSGEAASYLVAHKVRLVGIDSPSVDYPPSESHKILLAAGIAVVENLVNLSRLANQCMITILPLLLPGVDGSPVRAIARLEDGGSL